MEEESTRHTCLKLEPKDSDPIFVKATWFASRFDLSVTDAHNAWICHASEEEVRDRAAQWDQPVPEYVALAQRYLGFQQPDSVYGFSDAGGGYKRLSWTFEKEGTKLHWRWKCQPAPDSKKTTAEILDFLMDANIRLSMYSASLTSTKDGRNQDFWVQQCFREFWFSHLVRCMIDSKEEVVIKSQSCERLKAEAEKCLEQSEKISNETMEFKSALYAKFLGVLNSKKAKLREMRDQLARYNSAAGKLPREGESTDKTESFDDGSDDWKSYEESSENVTGTSKGAHTRRYRGRQRTAWK